VAQQVEKLQGIQFEPKGSSQGMALAKQWRGLNRAATLVACLTSPAVFLYMYNQQNARWWMALLGTILAIAAFRGLVDIIARRVIPWPNLFGAETALLQEDVVARRRAWYWRGKYRLVAFVFIIFGITWVFQVILNGNAGVARIPGVVWHFIDKNLAGSLSFSTAIQIVILLFANVGILIGPFLLMAIRQIKSYEPGDANWGVKLADVRGQAEAKQEITRVINLWQASDEFKKAGGKPERGLLFLGSPGTGKTMLAKGIATGFNSPFVTAPGSGFAGMFIGMDILAVQYLGWKAKKLARKWGGQCIVFIDEIDAVGLRRSALGTSSQVVGSTVQSTNLHDHLFYGPTGAITASGDVTFKTAAWRERMFAERAGAPAESGSHAFLANLGRRLDRTVNIVGGMGMMGGGSGALNQLLVLMDGIDEPPMMRRMLTNRTNALLDALYIVPRRIGKVSLRVSRAQVAANNIYFIGACNVSLDALDPALTRPGRLGRHIRFRTPIKKDRADIFDHYLAKVKHDPALDTAQARDELARITNGYSPAMIEQICSMALTYAHHEERTEFTREDIVEAMTTIESGAAVDVNYTESETRATAIHEAGHAVASHIYGEGVESTRLSIRQRGSSQGHHQAIEKEERFSKFRSEEIAHLIWIMGAICAEQVFYGENTNGVGGDMQSATTIASFMAGASAMGPPRIEFDTYMSVKDEDEAREKILRRFQRIGERLMAPVSTSSGAFTELRSGISGVAKGPIVAQLLGYSYYVAYNAILQNKDAVERIANALVEQREIHGDDIVHLLDSSNLKPAKLDYLEERTWPRL
jgi:ATP-dependent Zn protease